MNCMFSAQRIHRHILTKMLFPQKRNGTWRRKYTVSKPATSKAQKKLKDASSGVETAGSKPEDLTLDDKNVEDNSGEAVYGICTSDSLTIFLKHLSDEQRRLTVYEKHTGTFGPPLFIDVSWNTMYYSIDLS